MGYPDDVATAIRSALAGHADAERGEGMRRYLKSALPCYGVRVPLQRSLVAAVAAAMPPPDRESWRAAVLATWNGATHREERQAAITFSGIRAARPWQDARTLPLYRELIVTGAWWDLVDEVATHRVGPLLRADPDPVRPVVWDWATHEDTWLRRTAVICQVGARGDLDQALLEHAVRANVEDASFWLRKGIGWALRDAARTDPDWVRTLVADLGDRLSPLSRREALKHMGP